MADGAHPVAGVDYPRNDHELVSWFPDDGACLRYLERLRWGEGFSCRFCGRAGGEYWRIGRRAASLCSVPARDVGHRGHDHG